VDRLRGVGTHAALISAPAGFGKTTLLAQWISRTPLPVAWLSLDAGDNDPRRFLTYLASALEGVHEAVGTQVRPILQSARPILPDAAMASVINALQTLPEPAAWLDDFHS
jgi:LuxR family maltose regulon positive regulatory protein